MENDFNSNMNDYVPNTEFGTPNYRPNWTFVEDIRLNYDREDDYSINSLTSPFLRCLKYILIVIVIVVTGYGCVLGCKRPSNGVQYNPRVTTRHYPTTPVTQKTNISKIDSFKYMKPKIVEINPDKITEIMSIIEGNNRVRVFDPSEYQTSYDLKIKLDSLLKYLEWNEGEICQSGFKLSEYQSSCDLKISADSLLKDWKGYERREKSIDLIKSRINQTEKAEAMPKVGFNTEESNMEQGSPQDVVFQPVEEQEVSIEP